jgi:hypothetical protein
MILANRLEPFNGLILKSTQCHVGTSLADRVEEDDGIMAMTGRKGGIFVEFEPMSPDEMQQTMQFVLRQQAQFVADFERLSTKTDKMTDAIIGLTGIVGHLHKAQQETDRQIKETDRQLKETNQEVKELGEYIKTVESHLNVVMEMFERHLREDHGHRPS